MIRTSLIGASIAAIATVACAQEASTDAKTDMTAKIVDASQVETRDDAKLYAESEFIQADQNADGKVDKSEFIAYAAVRAPAADPVAKATSETAMAKKAGETAMDAAQTAEEQFAEISKGDEAISETELVETRVAQFDEADGNDDAALDPEERVQFAALTTPKAPETAL